MSPEVLARLAGANILVVAETGGYFVLARENCIGIVHSRAESLAIGSSGVLTDSGLAYLVWRDGRAMLAAHGGAQSPAAPEQVEAIQRFSEDLKAAIAQ